MCIAIDLEVSIINAEAALLSDTPTSDTPTSDTQRPHPNGRATHRQRCKWTDIYSRHLFQTCIAGI